MMLSDIKGIGPKRLALFSELHIQTPEDLLRFYPREYLDYSHVSQLRTLNDGDRVSIRVRVQSDPTVFYYKGKTIVSLRVSDGTGNATLRWMNQPYRANQFHSGDILFVHGVVSKKRRIVLYNPQINRKQEGIIPVYASIKGLPQALIRDAVADVLSKCEIPDPLPHEWLNRFALSDLKTAIREIHFPSDMEKLNLAKKRLSFDEAFLYFTAIQALKADRRRRNGFAFQTDSVLETFLASVSFQPTEAQLRTMHDVQNDMGTDIPMNRLVQGDVGSGKTLVAEFALAIAEYNHKQGVLLAPTELLAEQHFKTLSKRFPNACLYTGSMKAKEKKTAEEAIESGSTSVVIGTHALLSDVVRFHDLGLVITDEQHRFGVLQRAKIEEKGTRPDVLVMSATPIPRTLALLLYADLDLSVIDQLPPGRKPIKTHFVPTSKRKDLYRHLAECAKKGERAYIVCPLIEQTDGFEGQSLEELVPEIRSILPETKIGYLHGQMKELEKHAAMEAFRSGDTPVLIATTVVEVGVDVPEATAMVIEGADHFGLATLHQLRGRVGRGDLQSHCYLLAPKLSDHARTRIEAMLETNDGFVLAKKDLDMRGSGDLFGVKQSGEGETNSILSGCTVETIEMASKAADEVISLPSTMYNVLLEQARSRFQKLNHISQN